VSPPDNGDRSEFEELIAEEPTKRDQQINELQEELAEERDARREDRFVFIVVTILLFDIMIFAVMPTFGAPLAILILELLILIPLARRLGAEEIAKTLDRVLGRISDRSGGGD
jgi:hypothetical protein